MPGYPPSSRNVMKLVKLETQRGMVSWLERRSTQWTGLQSMATYIKRPGSATLKDVLEFVQGFRLLGRDVSLARTLLPQTRISRQLESLFLEIHEVINRVPSNLWEQGRTLFQNEVPRVIRELKGSILGTVGVFFLSGGVGWWLVASYPELAGLFASEEMIDRVQRGELWTEGLINIVPSSFLSLSIMTNNIMVSLSAFCLGALYGLGTLYIIGLNGLMLGGVFAMTAQYGLADDLFTFIIAHGVVELSIICLAGAAGVQLGEALARPGDQGRTDSFREAVCSGGTILPVCVLFLIGAGLIEGYISPDPAFSLSFRIGVGLSYGVLLWGVVTGKIWQWRKHPLPVP